LVSALRSPNGTCARLLNLVLDGRLTPCYDGRVLAEYTDVLSRERLGLEPIRVKAVLDFIRAEGEATSPAPLPPLEPDPDDTIFLEVARHLRVPLVTGNLKHFPTDPGIVSPAEFLERTASPRVSLPDGFIVDLVREDRDAGFRPDYDWTANDCDT
jgi:predicted nucleic acid-binding protein